MRKWLWNGCFLGWVLLGLVLGGQDLRQEVQKRRQDLMDRMQGGVLVLFSAPPRLYSNDVYYEYRQENNLYYLTGITQADVILVLMPQNVQYREILFLPERDLRRELWEGRMLSREEARQRSGIEQVWPASEFSAFVDAVFNGRPYRTDRYHPSQEYQAFFQDLAAGQAVLYLLLERRPGLSQDLSQEFEFANKIRERFVGLQLRDVTPYLHQMRLLKSPYEIARLQQAVDITVEAHRRVLEVLRPGIWEYELEAEIEFIYKKHNAFDWAFPSIVGSGPNATILHYQENQRRALQNELVLVDIGAEHEYYAADVTRTYPVSGRFTPEQRRLYEIVWEAQEAALNLVAPGQSIPALQDRAVEVLKKGLLELGLITRADSQQYRAYFPHGIGHWLGLDVHDVGSRFAPFQPGMVLTVEPGLYIREDAMDRLAEMGVEGAELEQIRGRLAPYLDLGIRIEDVVLVTEDGYRLLSGRAPRKWEEIEAAMGRESP